jgi:hypothetical protein
VLTLLNDGEWGKWPQAKIANTCGVSRKFVNQLSGQLSASCKRLQDGTREVERNGTTYEQNTAAIGKPSVTPFDPMQAKEIINQAKAIASGDIEASRYTVFTMQDYLTHLDFCTEFSYKGFR